MDTETKKILKPIVDAIAALAEKQALMLELMGLHSKTLSDQEKKILRTSAQDTRKISSSLGRIE